MKVTCIDKDIRDIFKSGYYRIPRFQRPYSWDRENIEEFWNDAIAESSGDYFIGAVVVFGRGSGVFGVVDGQQRLTAITMILCAVRNALSELGLDDMANGTHNLVERPDIDNKPQYVIQTETSYPYFQEHIQKRGTAATPSAEASEETSLRAAFEFLSAKVAQTVRAVEEDPSVGAEKKKGRIKKKLAEIRDKVLDLKLIFINLDREDDAYVIFETLNTRGKDLRVSDLVRNHFTKLIKPTNKNVDLAKDKWNAVVAMIEASQADIGVDDFLLHFWRSKYDFATSKTLFKLLRKEVRAENAPAFLDTLLEESRTYRGIHETSFLKLSSQERQVEESLRALSLFRVRQPLPMVLSVMREYATKALPLSEVKGMLRAIENFHFMFTAVTSSRSSGGISQMYARHARDLRAAQGKTAKKAVLGQLKGKLRDRKPKPDEFQASFREILCSDEYTKQKKLVCYILAKMDANQRRGGGVAADYDQMTIEHLGPQHPSGAAA